jgi:DNA-binding response OmpR family regulator
MRVLYLEDSRPDIRLVQQYMNSVNHEFDAAETIDQARQYLQRQRPDVFLVDLVIDGEMAYDLIEQAAKQKLSKHIVAITARPLPAERKRCKELGCDHLIAKPFTIDELERTLEQLAQK